MPSRFLEIIQFSEESFKALLSSIPQIVFISDSNAETLYLNQKWYEYTGHQPGDISRESWNRSIHPDDLSSILASWQRSIENKVTWAQEFRLRRRDGVYRWHLGQSTAEQDKGGTLLHWIGTVTDIEDQKMAERALLEINENLERKVDLRTKELRESNAFLDTVIENIPNMIFIKETDQLRFVRFNKAGEELLGVPREELIGKNDYDFFPKEEADFFQSKDRAVLSGRTVVDIPEENISTKSGQRLLHTKKLPVYDANGNPKYLLGISEDITELKAIEKERLQLIEEQIAKKEAQKTAERFQFLFQASDLLNSTLETEEILQNLSHLCVPQIADWCTVDLLQNNGHLKQIAVAHKDPDKVKLAIDFRKKFPPDPNLNIGAPRVVKTGNAEIIENITYDLFKKITDDQDYVKILEGLGFKSSICTPIKARGKILGTLTLVTSNESGRTYATSDMHLVEDIADRVGTAIENAELYKESRQLNSVKDEFLATLSHELRTPLNVILGHDELLKNEDSLTPDEIKTSIEAIYRNAKTQTGLIEDLLNVSSVITGKVSFNPTEVYLQDAITNIIKSLQATATVKDINLTLDMKDAPKKVFADATRLHQIVWNLVSNALKFTPHEGTVSIKVHSMLAQEEPHWEIIVTDNGLGIDPDFLPYVFDRFRQEDSSTTRKYGGLGLGLAIVRHLTELHGGTVKAESKGKNFGSTFKVCMPLKIPSTSTSETPSKGKTYFDKKASPTTSSLKGLKVLLVEDSEDSRFLIRFILERAEAEVVSAESAAEAREKLKQFIPDIIISDIGMPEENGMEFIQSLRLEKHGLDKKIKTIPAIALTAYVREEEKTAVLKAGFQAHVGKPVQMDQLLQEVHKLLIKA